MKTPATSVVRERFIDAIKRTLRLTEQWEKPAYTFLLRTPGYASHLYATDMGCAYDIVCGQNLQAMCYDYERETPPFMEDMDLPTLDIPNKIPIVAGVSLSLADLCLLQDNLEKNFKGAHTGVCVYNNVLTLIDQSTKETFEISGSMAEAWTISAYVSFVHTAIKVPKSTSREFTCILRDSSLGNRILDLLKDEFSIRGTRDPYVVISPGAHGFYIEKVIAMQPKREEISLPEDTWRTERFVGTKQGSYGIPHNHYVAVKVNDFCEYLDIIEGHPTYFTFTDGVNSQLTLSNSMGFVVRSLHESDIEG